MAWIKGFKITGGILAGEVFSVGGGSLSDTTWTDAPDINSNIFDRCYGENDGTFEGVNCLVTLQNVAVNDNIILWSLEIDQDTYFKSELLCKMHCINNTGGFEVELYRRDWSDMSTYTDTLVSNYTLTPQFKWNNPHEETKKLHAVFVQSNYNGYPVYFTGFSSQDYVNYWQEYHYYLDGFAIDMYKLHDVLGGNVNEGEYSPEFGPGAEPEGYDGGSFDYSSDFIDMPTKPQSVLSLGFVNVYKCEANALTDFGAALFPEIQWPQSLSDVGEVLAAFSDSIWNSKLIDYVVSVHCIPGDVTAGSLEDIKVGARTMTGILARKITNEYYDFDFGTLHTDPIYKNFVDQMCQAELYLPFYGFISLKSEQWNGGDLSVKYRINVIDGSFTAFVFSKPAKSEMTQAGLIGQYGGSCVVHLPVSSMSYASMFSGMVGGAAQTASGVASGNIAMAVSGAATAAGSTAGGDAKMSNSYNASSSFMTRRKPYLLVSAPIPSFSTRYNVECGLPTNQSMVLGTLSGLVKASNAILDAIPCTDNEREKIRAALASGLIF